MTMKYATSLAILLLGITLLIKVIDAQNMYKYIGANGEIVYSDRPPPTNISKTTIPLDHAPKVAPPEYATTPLPEVPNPSNNVIVEQIPKPSTVKPEITIFTATWCGYCTRARAYLDSNNIAYRNIDIDSRDGANALAQVSNSKGIPLLIAGNKRIQGFSKAKYDAYFLYGQ